MRARSRVHIATEPEPMEASSATESYFAAGVRVWVAPPAGKAYGGVITALPRDALGVWTVRDISRDLRNIFEALGARLGAS